MTQTVPLSVLSAFSAVTMSAGWLLLRLSAQQQLRERRIRAVRLRVQDPGTAEAEDSHGNPLLRLVASAGTLLSRSGMLPASTILQLEHTLASAGLRPQNALALFLGAKLLLLVLCPVTVGFIVSGIKLSSSMRLLLIGGAAVIGLLLPDFIMQRRRTAHLAAVSRGLPDALDMLVICSEAGLGLEMGLERVATEIESAHPAVAAELKVTCGELRILADRRTALTNMGARTGLETLKRLGGTLAQTLQYGTPLSQALRTLAGEMRYEMLMRFEAQAARLPVLLTVPMILFILPCILIVVGGPAALTVIRTFIH